MAFVLEEVPLCAMTRGRSVGHESLRIPEDFLKFTMPPDADTALSTPDGVPWKNCSQRRLRSWSCCGEELLPMASSSARSVATPIAAEHPSPAPAGSSTEMGVPNSTISTKCPKRVTGPNALQRHCKHSSESHLPGKTSPIIPLKVTFR